MIINYDNEIAFDSDKVLSWRPETKSKGCRKTLVQYNEITAGYCVDLPFAQFTQLMRQAGTRDYVLIQAGAVRYFDTDYEEDPDATEEPNERL